MLWAGISISKQPLILRRARAISADRALATIEAIQNFIDGFRVLAFDAGSTLRTGAIWIEAGCFHRPLGADGCFAHCLSPNLASAGEGVFPALLSLPLPRSELLGSGLWSFSLAVTPSSALRFKESLNRRFARLSLIRLHRPDSDESRPLIAASSGIQLCPVASRSQIADSKIARWRFLSPTANVKPLVLQKPGTLLLAVFDRRPRLSVGRAVSGPNAITSRPALSINTQLDQGGFSPAAEVKP